MRWLVKNKINFVLVIDIIITGGEKTASIV